MYMHYIDYVIITVLIFQVNLSFDSSHSSFFICSVGDKWHRLFYRPVALSANKPTVPKH